MKINEYTKEIEEMTEEEAVQKFGQDWSNYSFSVPDWNDDEEKIWAEQHAE